MLSDKFMLYECDCRRGYMKVLFARGGVFFKRKILMNVNTLAKSGSYLS